MAYADPMSRVPFFFFQNRENGIDTEATKQLEYEVPKMVTFILITPHGHRGDPMEFLAEEFIARKKKEAQDGRYDPSWVREFSEGLALFREGNEIPRHGTPLINWERILKTRRQQLSVRFPTVEDLAAVPDSSLGDIGLDGRVLRDMARLDIQAKKDLSPVVRELADANELIRQMQSQIKNLEEKMLTVRDDIDDTPKSRGRPKQAA